jgi:hypothetical protein
MAGAKRQVADGFLDRLLPARHVLQPVLVAPEHVVYRHVDPAALQIDAGEPFQIVEADQSLHRPPDLVVDPSRPGREEHEDQVAQQVGLSEIDARRVQRLEDAVGVVSLPGGDIDNRQPFHHNCRQPVQIQRLIVGTEQLDVASEKAVCLTDQIRPPDPGAASDAGEERRPVGLRGNQPEVRIPLLELVDQVQLVVTLNRLRVRLRCRVADRGQQQHQRRQPLLPVNNQEGCGVAGSVGKRRKDDTSEEVPRRACRGAIGGPCVLLQDVPPKQTVIGDPPRVLALPQRHPELLFPLHKLLEIGLPYLHPPSVGPNRPDRRAMESHAHRWIPWVAVAHGQQ